LPPLAIPASLQDTLMARLDRLAPVKEVAQLAATLGRTFSHELLATVSPLEGEALDDALSQLLDAGLIYRHGLPPDVTYAFKHALVQDVAYQSLLKGSRLQFHQRIAEVLEQRFPETIETQPELLAHHYTAAGRFEPAVAYWHRAGQRAVEHSANLEAIAHLTKGLELVDELPDTRERSKKELGMRLTLATALLSTKGWAAPEVEQTYLRGRELCRQIGEISQLFTVTWGLWLVYQQRGQLKQAQDLADEALALAKQQSDSGLLLQAHHAAWTNLFRIPDLPACREHLDQGLALYRKSEHGSHAFVYGGHDPGVCCLNHAALTLWFLGYVDQAQNMAQKAMVLAEALSHPFSLVLALSFSGFLRQFRREARLAQECAEATLVLCAERGIGPQFAAATKALRGWAVAHQGQIDEGIMDIQEGLQSLRATGTEQRKSYLLALLAEAYGKAEQSDRGLIELAEALESVEQSGERTWESELHRLKGELLLSRSTDNQEQAETCFNQAIAVAQRQSAKSLELRAAMSFARLLQAQGKSKEARELVQPIYGWFTEGFDTADLKDAKALIDQLR
jgi:predicted ATPase